MMRCEGRVCVVEDDDLWTRYLYYGGADVGYRMVYETPEGWRGPRTIGAYEMSQIFSEYVVYCRLREKVPGVVAALSRTAAER